MALGFSGEVVEYYQRYRRGYPPPVIDAVVSAVGLTASDVVIDLGCGTGQLTLPLAHCARTALGVDPEPDMLAAARRAAAGLDGSSVSWLLGDDTDIPNLLALLGPASVAAVTVAQALHWMDHRRLFADLRPLLRRGGGIAVVTNGKPLWQQDAEFSRALDAVLADWLGRPLTATCGTDDRSQARYRADLVSAGYVVSEAEYRYSAELTLEEIVGAVWSAVPADRLPPMDERDRLAARIGNALAGYAPFVEDVRVQLLFGVLG
jgi:SAM-dependent methyltransferase